MIHTRCRRITATLRITWHSRYGTLTHRLWPGLYHSTPELWRQDFNFVVTGLEGASRTLFRWLVCRPADIKVIAITGEYRSVAQFGPVK